MALLHIINNNPQDSIVVDGNGNGKVSYHATRYYNNDMGLIITYIGPDDRPHHIKLVLDAPEASHLVALVAQELSIVTQNLITDLDHKSRELDSKS